MKEFKRILNKVLSVILALTLVFAGYVLVTVLRTEKGKVPAIFGYSFLQVATGSMEPTIPTGSIIVVKHVDAQTVQTGDVICFYSSDPAIEGVPNTHRVVDITKGDGQIAFTTMGDAIGVKDPYPVFADQLVGVYQRSLSIGKFVDVLHSRYFFFFALLIPLCIVIFVELLRVKKIAEKKEESDAKDS